MKKIFLLLLCSSFLACIKHPTPKPQETSVLYSFDVGKDMGSLFDFMAIYVDGDQKTATERINSLPWKKQVDVGIPFDARLEIAFEAKTDIPDKTSYDVGFKGNITQKTIQNKAVNFNETRANDTGMLRFAVTLPVGILPDEVNLTVAPLKFDKHFAFTFTVDDAFENGWSKIFRLIHGKWIDDEEFFHMGCTPTTGYYPESTLCMTDGCGNERRFGFGEAIWPTLRNFFGGTAHDPRMQESSTSSIYITWEELRIMLDFGCSVYFHNVDETKYDKTDPAQIFQGLSDDYHRTVEKLGRRMKILALPDGNKAYLEAATSFPQIEFTRNSTQSGKLIFLNECGSLRGLETYGGESTQSVEAKLRELSKQAVSDNPYWVGMTVHRASQEHMDMLTQVYKLYGKAGADNIWVASWDEVYEYQELRYGSTIEKSVEGQTVTFEVTVPQRSNFYFHELSFLISGTQGATITPVCENIYGLSSADRNGKMLVNINFDPKLPERAEKYTSKYEASGLETDKDDAGYIVSLLRPDLAAPFLARLDYTEPPVVLSGITINEGANMVYNRLVRVAIDASASATSYRIGETADLSSQAWQDFDGSAVEYTISKEYGSKTIYVQVSDGNRQSGVVSETIRYADVPESGVIDRDAVKAYLEKYDGYTYTLDKIISKGN